LESKNAKTTRWLLIKEMLRRHNNCQRPKLVIPQQGDASGDG